MATINGASIETLAADFAGELIQAQSAGYDAARQIWNGHVQRRPALIAELRRPAFDAIAPKPYVAHQKMFDVALPHGRHYYWKSHKLGPLTDEIIDVVVDQSAPVTSPLSTVPIFCFGGAVARVPEESTAFPYRDASHDINVVGSWLPEEVGDAERHIEWVRGFCHALEPYSRGVYVNFTSDDSRERVRDAYPEQQWTRLTALKAKYDPTNFFCMNANIPAG